MKEFTLAGIQDLWNDYSTAIVAERVNLADALICQYKAFQKKDEKEDIVKLLVTSTATMIQENKIAVVSNKITPELSRIGCFYLVGKRKYLPTGNVQGQCLYDYFGIKAEQVGNGFFDDSAALLLASRFRNTGKIWFVTTRPKKGFCKLLGMKTMSGCNQEAAVVNIVKWFHEKESARFYSAYTEQKQIQLDFEVYCRIENRQIRGLPLYIMIRDNATARKSLQLAVVAELEGRMLKLQSMYVNHRVLTDSSKLAEDAMNMLEECEKYDLNIKATGKEIVERLVPFVPKKGRAAFEQYIVQAESPIKAAYDIMETDIFNLLAKQHKTQYYDGGKGKYEEALGKFLLRK